MAYPYYSVPNYQQYQPTYVQPTYQVQQPVAQPTYQPVQQQTPQSSIIWISGEREAMAYPVAPNNAVTLWSQSEPVVYLKQADATGKPSVKIYDLVERVQSAEVSASDGKTVEYATKSDLSAVAGIIGGIKSDIESIKSDMYGIAGKKKTKKAKEEEDEE
ncbi:MAG: hypothetical protein J6S14_03065 [Clostridia bacterium]|nr:hypothetical protein [Clostridia bacterium]